MHCRVKEDRPLSSPKKTRHRKKPVTDIDDFDKMAIRNAIYDMYRDKQHVTLVTLHNILQERGVYNGGRTSLSLILRNIGFRWKKDDPRRALMEQSHITLGRIDFLMGYVKNKNENRLWEPVFLDETWIFENGTIGRSWQDQNIKSVKRTKVDGRRYIIVHAGNRKGFIPGAALTFPSKRNDLDYHGEMNSSNFLLWFEEQLLKNLEQPSLIIMDNAPYHSVTEKSIPTSMWKKVDIQGWLNTNKIQYDDNLLKPQLLQLVKQHSPRKVYVADKLAEKYGHKVLRLPPYHCTFNAIENVWGIAKKYYNVNIGKYGGGAENVLRLWQDALEHVTPEMWSNCIDHVAHMCVCGMVCVARY